MSVNKFKPHVWIIPEDRADEELANGFLLHYAVAERAAQVARPAGGWSKVLDVFETEYLKLLQNPNAHVIMLIDFDEKIEDRKTHFERRIPEGVRSRVFVIGSKGTPESLKRELGMTLERIGTALAEDCLEKDFEVWHHAHLMHNSDELQRLVDIVKPILFQRS
jgi:hypothetical protein